MQGLEQSPAELVNIDGNSDILLVCEHASNYIPESFNNLGLSQAERLSHIGWDIGAEGLARELSAKLNAGLILQRYSRLLYDCNRPPSEPSSIPPLSELTEIAGNTNLTAEQIDYRVNKIYHPFHADIEKCIADRQREGRDTILVTVHSFTPVFKGESRAVELGIICENDNIFAKAFYETAKQLSQYDVRLNEPYGPSDPVLHMVTRHGTDNQLKNVMLEVRNDLIEQVEGQQEWAELIAQALLEMSNK